jgi:hypothetical protein
MNDLHRAVAAHKELVERIRAAFPEESEETLADSILGETALDAAILSVLRAAIYREAHADAIEGMIDTLASRKRRLAEGAQALRRAARDAMIEGGMPKLTSADLTVSVRDGKPKVIVTDEKLIPDLLCRFTRSPNKTDIGEVLRNGHAVPGATFGNADPVLTIRRS